MYLCYESCSYSTTPIKILVSVFDTQLEEDDELGLFELLMEHIFTGKTRKSVYESSYVFCAYAMNLVLKILVSVLDTQGEEDDELGWFELLMNSSSHVKQENLSSSRFADVFCTCAMNLVLVLLLYLLQCLSNQNQ